MINLRQITGHLSERFGRWTVIGLAEPRMYRGYPRVRYRVRCDCGNEGIVERSDLRTGHSRSCGCLKWDRFFETVRRHGHGSNKNGLSATYRTWRSMKQRCLNPRDKRFHRYAGRGITICDRWLVFENFLADMGEKPLSLSIDRIDNNGNYEPGNCRWATWKEQRNNQNDIRMLEYNGQRLSLQKWAVISGIAIPTLKARLRSGWNVEQALTIPVKVRRKKS